MLKDVPIQRLHPKLGAEIPLPARMSEHAAGFDLAAALDQPLTLQPGQRQAVPCGFAIAVPPGFEAQIRPRSGLAIRNGITVVNAPGTVDSDYRGEVKVLLVNLGAEPFTIEPATRIAQMVIAPVATPALRVVEELPATERGAGGFGSTGIA